ncbi:recombinase family protein [Streptomyces lunaelactis]|nr:recombinase family protein [Streptomyces lunaelactis]NUK87122.1 recombinase family protein [Streptomyces lunaelactis]
MTPSRAVILVRISDDKAGDAQGVGRQEEDCRSLAQRLGWTVAQVVTENDTSAYKRKRIKLPDGTSVLRTVRPRFRYVLDGLASGEFDGLIAYDLDRVARDMRDLEDLVDVVQSGYPHLPVESVSGSLRLANSSDIAMARVMTVMANKSSSDTGRRVARKHEELAAAGKPGGGGFRGYGYDVRNLEIVPEEAEIVREIAGRILDDESLNAIAADLQAREVPTVTGAPWNSRSVKSIVTKPRVAGLRAHRGDVVGDAVWPPILDRGQWEDVCARLAGRVRNVDLTLQRWLTGVLVCSKCGRTMPGAQGNNGVRYWCATPRGGCGKIAIKAEPVEAEIERRVLEGLSGPQVLEQLRHAATTEATDDARRSLAEDEQQLKELAGMWARKQVSLAEYREARSLIEARVKDSRAFVTSRAPRVLRRLLAGDIHEGWHALTPADKREVVIALGGMWRVMPHDRSKGNKFNPARLVPIEAGEQPPASA